MRAVKSTLGWFVKPVNLIAVLASLIPLITLWFYVQPTVRNFPRFDQGRVLPIVYAAARGELSWQLLLQPEGGHVTLFSYLLTVFLVNTAHWDVRIETYFNFVLGAANFMLLLLVFRQMRAGRLAWVLYPISLLLFSIGQDMNWMLGYYGVWHFAAFFFLLGLVSVSLFPGRWWSLMLAIIWGFCATLSMGGGFIAFPAILIYLLFYRDRRWGQIVVWIMATVAALALQTWLIGGDRGLSEPMTVLRLWEYAVFTLGYPGGYLAYGANSRPFWNALLYSVGAIILLLGNMIYLKRVHGKDATIWLSVAGYTLGTGALVALSRFDEYGYVRVFETWYFTNQALFWIAVVVVTVVGSGYALQRRDRLSRGLVYVNILAIFIGGVRYIPASYYPTQNVNSIFVKSLFEQCPRQYLFVQSAEPDCLLFMEPEVVNRLAQHRLTMFSQIEPRNLLDVVNDDAQQPILIETHNAWLNVQMRDYLLRDIDPARIVHIFPENIETESLIYNPLEPSFYSGDDIAMVSAAELLADGDFWYIRRNDFSGQSSILWGALSDDGYAIVDTLPRPENMLLSAVRRVPQRYDEPLRFGEAMYLDGAAISDRAVQACDTVEVKTLWHSAEDQGVGFSGTFHLVNESGETVLKVDSGLGTIGTDQWLVDGLYTDDRLLEIPCDFAEGDYALAVGVYFYQDPKLFEVDNPMDAVEDNLVLLEMITIGE